MKIGRFAETNDVSLDTIRHYMELGLIVPLKCGGQYDFDERCEKDLKDILSLKQMGFTLNEIKVMLMFLRLGNLTVCEEEQYYKEFFTSKLSKVIEDINKLTACKEKLQNKINDLSSKTYSKNFTMGVDISTLKLIKCCRCGEPMMLSEAHIADNQIINGKLKCSCGEEYIIDDGILLGKGMLESSSINFDNNYVIDYVNFTDYKYLDNIYKGLEWAYKKLDFTSLRGSTMLELGSGIGFFLRHIYNSLPEDTIYIAVDYDLNRQKFLKNTLEMANCRRNILFICSDFSAIPLKDSSIDMVIDFSGTSNYSFEHEDFLLKNIMRYVNKNSCLLAAFIMFKNFAVKTDIREPFRKNFIMSNVKNEITGLGYKLIEERVSDYIDQGGKYEDYFKEDEKVYTYMFYGKR